MKQFKNLIVVMMILTCFSVSAEARPVGEPLYILWSHFDCQDSQKYLFGQIYDFVHIEITDNSPNEHHGRIGLGVEKVSGDMMGMTCETLRPLIMDAYQSFFDAEVVGISTKKTTDGGVVRTVELAFPAVPNLVLQGERLL